MVRIVVDQSYQTHIQTGVISCTPQFCTTQVHHNYRTEHLQDQDVILLEDNGFDRIITTLSRYAQEACTVKHFKHLVNREIALHHQHHHISTQIMTFLISDTLIDGVNMMSPWGHQGQIQCRVQLLLLKSKILPKHIVTQCKLGQVRIVPKSLYTIEFLNQHIKWSDYCLLYIEEHVVKCIIITNGQISDIQYLNWGLCELKHLMDEMHVGGHYRRYDTQINQLTRSLIIKSVQQYAKILTQWLGQYCGSLTSVAVINRLSDHELINQECIRVISEKLGIYALECTSIIPRKTRRGDVDVHAYLCQHEEIVY